MTEDEVAQRFHQDWKQRSEQVLLAIGRWARSDGVDRPCRHNGASRTLLRMLAQASATIPYASGAVASALAAPTHPWSVALDGDGRELLAKVGFSLGPIPLYKHVQLQVGDWPTALPADSLMLPVMWEAVGGPPIFPRMEGTLHVEPERAGVTKLTLNARYDPPLGKLGERIDRVLMHRLAQITMSDFIERLARALADDLERAQLGQP